MIEAQKRLKELQKQERERLKLKDNRDYYLNFLRNQRFSKQDTESSNLQALDLGFNPQSRIPKPSLVKKPEVQGTDESKIPKLKNPLCRVPEKPENLPWKKGDLLDSLDLSSTNLKKMFQNRPKLCESPGREKNGKEPEWLKENFRESINEWAPKKIEALPEVKLTKRVLPRNVNKVGFADRIGELKEMNKAEKLVKNVKFSEDKSEKVSKRYERSCFEEGNEGELVQDVKKNCGDGKVELRKVDEKVNVRKQSRFVNKIKAIPEAKDDFLECELHCVNDEEAKLEASLARLDFKSLKLKHQAELAQIELQAKQLEESIKRSNFQNELNEVQQVLNRKNPEPTNNEEKYSEKAKAVEKILVTANEKSNDLQNNESSDYENDDFEVEEKKVEFEVKKEVVKRKISPGVESSTNITSQFPDNASVFSAHPYPRQRPSPDSRSVVSEYPDRPRNCYSKKEVHRIGAVYNEIAARSGRYGKKNPAPEYALPKNQSKEKISFRKPPPGPEYTTEVVKVNPNFDIKSLLQD